DWIDADVEIERVAGKTIARIFAEDGEPVFRDIEARVIADLTGRSNLVIAAGGGAPLRAESRAAMRAGGPVAWLQASAATIHQRMTGDATTASRRPSLTDRGPLDEILHVMTAREPIYRETADVEIDTEGKSPQRLADEILGRLDLPGTPGAGK
ncbi:MAG: shikimate kinase, partial [Thermoguttaceae bacterium]